jgi:hypothetical protein
MSKSESSARDERWVHLGDLTVGSRQIIGRGDNECAVGVAVSFAKQQDRALIQLLEELIPKHLDGNMPEVPNQKPQDFTCVHGVPELRWHHHPQATTAAQEARRMDEERRPR